MSQLIDFLEADSSTPAFLSLDEETGDLSIIGKDDERTEISFREGTIKRNDRIIGGDLGGFIDSGAGNDAVIGGDGDYELNGGEGNDIIIGGEGSDTIEGGLGSDIIVGGLGSDTIDGGEGSDIIIAGNSGNELTGGEGSDIIIGGAGEDIIYGGTGSDILAGSAGNDIFRFNVTDFEADEIDYILDFTDGEDKIEIEGANSVEYDSSTGTISVDGVDRISLDSGLDIDINVDDTNGNDTWELM